jgi:ParB-like chromosome segregation protein Spo0J
MNNPAFFPIQSLTSDSDLQIRAKINKETISLYAEQMTTEDEMKKFPPVEVYYDGTNYWLADGHHRRAAAEKAGHSKVWAVVKNGTRDDALWGAILGNGKQGFGLTQEDRKRAILLAIKRFPDKSNRIIAVAVGCSEQTVRRLRPETSTAPNGAVEERRTGKDGKSRPAKQKTTSKKTDKKQKTAAQSQSEEGSEKTKPETFESPQESVDSTSGLQTH